MSFYFAEFFFFIINTSQLTQFFLIFSTFKMAQNKIMFKNCALMNTNEKLFFTPFCRQFMHRVKSKSIFIFFFGCC